MAKFNKYKAYQYDSKWEESLVNGLLKDIPYHPEKFTYIRPSTTHTYTPDWILHRSPITVCIEAKGRFRSRDEMNKYLDIKKCWDECKTGLELVFLFQKPHQPVFGVKARKDGTKMSHAEFAEKHGIRWFSEDTIKELLSE